MKIEKITVRAGRCVPHPLHSYGNLKGDLEFVAQLEDGDDPDTVRKQLQSQVESDIEQHMADLKHGIHDLEVVNSQRERMKRLESELEKKTAELDSIKAEFEDRPLLKP